MTDRREILDLQGPDTTSPTNDDYWYVEGHSPAVDEIEGHGTWFCFEEPWDKVVSELRKLGFTRKEIDEARERLEKKK